jgi:hypothetical protein
MAGRQGVSRAIFRDPSKDKRFALKSNGAIDLGLSDSCVSCRPFAAVFGLCQCNVTHNGTRRESLAGPSRQPLSREPLNQHHRRPATSSSDGKHYGVREDLPGEPHFRELEPDGGLASSGRRLVPRRLMLSGGSGGERP